MFSTCGGVIQHNRRYAALVVSSSLFHICEAKRRKSLIRMGIQRVLCLIEVLLSLVFGQTPGFWTLLAGIGGLHFIVKAFFTFGPL